MLAMNRGQLNARVAQNLKSRVGLDKVKANTTQDIIIEVALENWFSAYPLDRRAEFYKRHRRKPYGVNRNSIIPSKNFPAEVGA